MTAQSLFQKKWLSHTSQKFLIPFKKKLYSLIFYKFKNYTVLKMLKGVKFLSESTLILHAM